MKKRIYAGILASLLCLCLNTRAFAFDKPASSDLLLLINKTFGVAPEYASSAMLDIAKLVPAYKSTILLREDAAAEFANMYAAMVAEGINNMKALSGYRDFQYQTGLFSRQTARCRKWGESYESAMERASWSVARPGTSEHQAGLAIDVSTDGSTSLSFRSTRAYAWLKDNGHRFGFVIRYAEDKTAITSVNFEPWHLRYVGKPHAAYMAENNLCFEEYTELLKNAKHITVPDENGWRYDVYSVTDAGEGYENIIDISSDNCGGYIITTHSPDSETQKEAQDQTQVKTQENTLDKILNTMLTNKGFYDTLCKFGDTDVLPREEAKR